MEEAGRGGGAVEGGLGGGPEGEDVLEAVWVELLGGWGEVRRVR